MLKRLMYRMIAILLILFVFTTSAIFFPTAVVIWFFTYPFDRNLHWLHLFTCFWASLYIWVFPPWQVDITGKQHINNKQTYIIVSNHQSLVDILVAFTLFTHFKWVSKAELFNIPFIGWNMYLNRYVRLKRGKGNSIRSMYKACEKHLKRGSSVYLFPEGTRSPTGRVRPFKEGAFVLSKRLNIPILPIVINGSKNAVPKNSLNFHGNSHVTMEVLKPFFPDDDVSVRDLRDEVRAAIVSRVVEEQNAVKSDGRQAADR
ncbi:MAG: lysophospholipid acyltransferase family protein [Pseudomonadales bacterium]|nr:lysophospholipid acyltransferase family protein [Pseudomonadales bacterium]